MKKTDTLKELRSLADTEANKKLVELREELRVLLFKAHGDEVKDIHKARNLRKQISRLLTVMSEQGIIKRS